MTDRDPSPRVAEELRQAARLVASAIAGEPALASLEREILETGRLAAACEKAGDETRALAYGSVVDVGIRAFATELSSRAPAIRELGSLADVEGWVVLYFRSMPELAPYLPKPPLTFAKYPSLPAGTVMALRDETDVHAMAQQLAPGQVWLRVDATPNDERPLAWSLAKYQQAVIGGVKKGGRPAGSASQPSAAERTAADRWRQGMTKRQVYDLLLEAGVYPDDGPFNEPDDRERNRQRVRRFLHRHGLSK